MQDPYQPTPGGIVARRRTIMFQYEKAWQDARARIAAAGLSCARDPAAIRLLAVSKAHPAEAVRALHPTAEGHRALAERTAGELAAIGLLAKR